MGLLKVGTRHRKTVPGSLGTVVRSTGYLQGGYKGSVIHSKVQMFNTVTQAGSIIYDTGFARSYRPGVTGNLFGYFSTSDSPTNYNKFSYTTNTAAVAPFSVTGKPAVTAADIGNLTQSWMVGDYGGAVTQFAKLSLTSESVSLHGAINTEIGLTSRQAAGNTTAAFFLNVALPAMHTLTFGVNTVERTELSAIFDSTMQIPCGMSISDSRFYFVGMYSRNNRVNTTGKTILSYLAATPYTYHFGESHSVVSRTEGFMMAGYSDTTGRYDGTQHGLCQKMSIATEAIGTLPDLALAQSSGQMMQGY